MRKILGVYSAPRQHWVGDGFPVRTLLSHHDQGRQVSPFILLDYDGAELARLRGYPGDHFFWPLLGEMIGRLGPPT